MAGPGYNRRDERRAVKVEGCGKCRKQLDGAKLLVKRDGIYFMCADGFEYRLVEAGEGFCGIGHFAARLSEEMAANAGRILSRAVKGFDEGVRRAAEVRAAGIAFDDGGS